jgi:hypothetical protein
MSFVARPSLRCVLSTAKEAIWPWHTADSSSLKNQARKQNLREKNSVWIYRENLQLISCPKDQQMPKLLKSSIQEAAGWVQAASSQTAEHISHDLLVIIFRDIQKLWPWQYMIHVKLNPNRTPPPLPTTPQRVSWMGFFFLMHAELKKEFSLLRFKAGK